MELKQTTQFKRDLKRYKHAHDLLEELKNVLKELRDNGKVPEEPDIERCLKEDINGKVPEEPVTEKCLKECIDKDDPDDEKGTEKYEISINYALNGK